MLISSKKKQDRKTFSSEKALVKAFGQEQARKIAQRLSEIQAADNLEILRTSRKPEPMS